MNAPAKIEAAPPAVYSAITAVMAHMANVGIAKDRKNEQQRYRFRGIDDIYNALASVLSANRLVMLPFVQDMQREERATKAGGALNYTILTVDFTLVSADDGSQCVIRMVGEAMDSADKSANKAMSAALKYAAIQVFMIPTEGDNDADATTHEIAASTPRHAANGTSGDTAGARKMSSAGPNTSNLREQLEQSVAQTRDLPFPQGPAKNKTELKAMGRALWREIEGCGDDVEMSCLLGEPSNVALVNQLREALPAWWDGFEKDGEIHDGLCDVIAKKTKEFTATALDNAR